MHLLFPAVVRPQLHPGESSWRRTAGAFATFTGLALAALCAIVYLRDGQGPTDLDRAGIRLLHVDGHGTLFQIGKLVSLVSSPGVVAAAGLSVGALLFFKRRSLDALLAVAAPGVAGIGETALKHIVARPRPFTAAITGESGFGFPSGHTAGFTALALMLLVLVGVRHHRDQLWLVLSGIAILAVGAARLLVGAHYVTDVGGGLLLGMTVTFGLYASSAHIDALARKLPLVRSLMNR